MTINQLLILIRSYPDKRWSEGNISENPNFTLEMMEKFPDLCEYYYLSYNPNITPEFVEKHINKNWKFIKLLDNPRFTWEFVEKHMDKKWNWTELAANSIVTVEIYTKYIDKFEKYNQFYSNPNITKEIIYSDLKFNREFKFMVLNLENYINKQSIWEYILENPSNFPDWHRISGWSHITQEIIESNPTYPWDYSGLSFNPNISEEFITKYIHKKWIWYNISTINDLNTKNLWEFIKKYSDKFLDWYRISANLNISWDVILANLDYPWDFHKLCERKDITMEIVKKLPLNKLCWKYLSKNKCITLSDIESNLDYPWDWGWISGNPNLTAAFVKKHIDKHWMWWMMSGNEFNF